MSALSSMGRMFALALTGMLLFACTKDELARNVYEGARVHNESLRSTPLENPRLESLNHDEYEKARSGDGGDKGALGSNSPRCAPDGADTGTCTPR